MPEHARFRDAARVRVDAPPDRVRELISSPAVLGALDDRLAEAADVRREDDRVAVRTDRDGLRFEFRLTADGDGTRVAALERVEPEGLLDRTRRMLFPDRAHEDLERDLDRLRHLLEALDDGSLSGD